jgi:cytoskeletal protein CcmA (bactofilin family)
MFKQKRRRDAAIGTLVGRETRVHGDLEFTGGCLVDGYVKGNVKSIGDENATLSISERGCVEGAVIVPNVLLNGTVKGDVKATQRVELGSSARVVGNVQYSLIEMAIGAEVNGKLIHESEASERKAAQLQSGTVIGAADADQPEPVSGPTPVARVKIAGE